MSTGGCTAGYGDTRTGRKKILGAISKVGTTV
ncbi:MAG: hypothetical protein PWR25_107 [Euryarchaeota archaeon]|nr:hypothetical protein [Euryarchaeota archaeon]